MNAPHCSARAAPRERGWTHIALKFHGRRRGCPARAGMDPRAHARPCCGPRLPRASGDGPSPDGVRYTACGAAPRERGWTPPVLQGGAASDGCPARAGMDPITGCASLAPMWLPRASGDGPMSPSFPSARSEAAPRERGWTRPTIVVRRGDVGCPARAGMDPGSGGARRHQARLPRASGDGPPIFTLPVGYRPAAPRERGWTRPDDTDANESRGCPARAGMDLVPRGRIPTSAGLPRASGDGPHCSPPCLNSTRAAPRERGWTPKGASA